jgi:hypothetical protein
VGVYGTGAHATKKTEQRLVPRLVYKEKRANRGGVGIKVKYNVGQQVRPRQRWWPNALHVVKKSKMAASFEFLLGEKKTCAAVALSTMLRSAVV